MAEYTGPQWEITTESINDKCQNVFIVWSFEWEKVKDIADKYCKAHNQKLVSIKPWRLNKTATS